MPAIPISEDEQSEATCVELIASTVQARGSYCEPLAIAIRSLNAVCARIFHLDPPEDEQRAAGGAP